MNERLELALCALLSRLPLLKDGFIPGPLIGQAETTNRLGTIESIGATSSDNGASRAASG